MKARVAQRTAEIGVRIALGAERRTVIGAVLRSAVLLAACGIGLGVAAALGVTRFLTAFLFGVSPTDALTFGAVPALFLAVALAAAYVPARRAARTIPSKHCGRSDAGSSTTRPTCRCRCSLRCCYSRGSKPPRGRMP